MCRRRNGPYGEITVYTHAMLTLSFNEMVLKDESFASGTAESTSRREGKASSCC